MTTHDRDKIIAAAKEANGLVRTEGNAVLQWQEHFYAIAFEDGRKAEREECTKVAISYDSSPWAHDQAALHVADIVASVISKQIRARSTK